MLSEKHLEKYADVLLWARATAKKQPLKQNDIVLIQYDLPALKLTEILYDRLLALGVHPVQRMVVTCGMEQSFYAKSNSAQLTFIAPGDKELYSQIAGRIFLHAPESLTHLKQIDPARIGKAVVARKVLKDILDRREEKRRYSWTLCLLPTAELARQAGMPLRQYAAQIVKGCHLDADNPVGRWEEIHKEVTVIKNR